MHYEIGWHSSDKHYCHVALVSGDYRNELFDVALYQLDGDGGAARADSLFELERLVYLANSTMNEAAK